MLVPKSCLSTQNSSSYELMYWHIIDKSKNKNISKSNIVTTFIPAKGSKAVKHKQDEINDNLVVNKKIKSSLPSDLNSNCPIGLEWDSQNWSCHCCGQVILQ